MGAGTGPVGIGRDQGAENVDEFGTLQQEILYQAGVGPSIFKRGFRR
jgi:hypothetical protein